MAELNKRIGSTHRVTQTKPREYSGSRRGLPSPEADLQLVTAGHDDMAHVSQAALRAVENQGRAGGQLEPSVVHELSSRTALQLATEPGAAATHTMALVRAMRLLG